MTTTVTEDGRMAVEFHAEGEFTELERNCAVQMLEFLFFITEIAPIGTLRPGHALAFALTSYQALMDALPDEEEEGEAVMQQLVDEGLVEEVPA